MGIDVIDHMILADTRYFSFRKQVDYSGRLASRPDAKLLQEQDIVSRVLYFDCFNGASGDMVLGALLDAGLPLDELQRALGSLALRGVDVGGPGCCERVSRRRSSWSTRRKPSTMRSDLADVHRLIDTSALSPGAQSRANELFHRLGEAEADVHQMPIDRIHLHEVGAIDSIIDIVGVVFALEWFDADRIVSSPLNVGGGMVHTAHGHFPVPAPATVRLLARSPGVLVWSPERARDPDRRAAGDELCHGLRPCASDDGGAGRYGAGDRDIPDTPNVLRVHLIGQSTDRPDTERIVVLECEIDDMNPQLFGSVMDRLYPAGALEVDSASVQMKKNRPGTLVTTLARPEQREDSTVIFRETTTIGVRYHEVTRERLEREIVPVETPLGAIRFKVARLGGQIVNSSPEFEDCLRIATSTGIPVKEAQAAATKAYLDRKS